MGVLLPGGEGFVEEKTDNRKKGLYSEKCLKRSAPTCPTIRRSLAWGDRDDQTGAQGGMKNRCLGKEKSLKKKKMKWRKGEKERDLIEKYAGEQGT